MWWLMKKILLTIYLMVTLLPVVQAAHKYPEAYYQNKWCQGVIEYTLEDNTRIDCLTETHAIEFDFAKKWAEAIGQSLHYSRMTGKKAGIVLIMESERDYHIYLPRIKAICDIHNIDLWTYDGDKIKEIIKKLP
jgi:hypothetical protein